MGRTRQRGMNWANRTVFTGDNLDVMRGMNSESVDLIYADPPFNSNKNYAAPIGSAAAGAAFKDTWTLSDIDVAWLGIIADHHPGVYKVVEAAGVTHGKGMQFVPLHDGDSAHRDAPSAEANRQHLSALRFNRVTLSQDSDGRGIRPSTVS